MIKKKILRFNTAGSVDDGKSTLIGRLLLDTNSIAVDQLKAIEIISKKNGYDFTDLSLITDGLKSEREQGITIDVAYRYFETQYRKFIIADSPGHIQYTRNMVTAASTADLSVILIDATKGLLAQTKRHLFISSLVNIKRIIVCINKMDLVDFEERNYLKIVNQCKKFCNDLNFESIIFIPISARNGDNIVSRSSNMKWFKKDPLIKNLNQIKNNAQYNIDFPRFSVQYVIRPRRKFFEEFRGFAGMVENGVFRKGDKVKIIPSQIGATIDKIFYGEKEVKKAEIKMSVTVTLKNDIDISRGDWIVGEKNIPNLKSKFKSSIVWMSYDPLNTNDKLILKQKTKEVSAIVTSILSKYNYDDFSKISKPETLELNEIGIIEIITSEPIICDEIAQDSTNNMILINPKNNETVGACVIK
tara:strand:+ start:164 stop:1411 length:1248 start_codon:yes stop_codon:yes gene_type:complete